MALTHMRRTDGSFSPEHGLTHLRRMALTQLRRTLTNLRRMALSHLSMV